MSMQVVLYGGIVKLAVPLVGRLIRVKAWLPKSHEDGFPCPQTYHRDPTTNQFAVPTAPKAHGPE